jgi:hypothetical protein
MEKRHWFDVYKEIDDLIEKKRYKTIVFVTVIELIRALIISAGTAGLGYGFYQAGMMYQSAQAVAVQSSQNKTSSQVNISNRSDTSPIIQDDLMGLVAGANAFVESEWDIKDNRGVLKEIGKDGSSTGYYCAKERKGFEVSEIWNKDKLKVGDSIDVRFSLKQDVSVKNFTQEPKFILLYGRAENKSARYRLFFPNPDINFIGFEDTLSTKRFSPKSLLKPLDVSGEKEIELEFSVESSHLNEGSFHYKLTHVSADSMEDESKQIEDEGSFQSTLPWPNPRSVGAEQEFGIGAYPGTCFRVSSFRKTAAIKEIGLE